MLEQPDSPSVSQTKQQLFDHYLYRLQSEIHTILSAESGYDERCKNLENDLAVFKRACVEAENSKRLLNEEVATLRKKLEHLDSQKSADKRMICLIDGNDTIFAPELLARGEEGGIQAAKELGESIRYHLTPVQPCHLWTHIFFSKSTVLNALSTAGSKYREARERFDDFLVGFNQSSERFVMTDLGGDDGTTTAKVKAYLEFQARSHETYKVVFGGCNTNIYMPQLHSLQLNSLYHDKLVLLPGLSDIDPEINQLQLPSLVIPNLFVSERLLSEGRSRQSSATSQTSPLVSPTGFAPPGLASPRSAKQSDSSSRGSISPPPPPYPRNVDTDEIETKNTDTVRTKRSSSSILSPHVSDRQPRVVLGHAHGPVSYRPWTQDHRESQSEGEETMGGKEGGRMRKLNPDIPLNQHKPPPCTLFYLAANGCKHGPDCRFGHDYILDDDDYEALRLNAKKVPCPAVNRGEICAFGENCCYGHTCPFLTRCHWFKNGTCKFSGPNMHLENEILN